MSYKNIMERRAYQREYYRRVRKQQRRDRKQRLANALGGKCMRCGYDKCVDALHFHHSDPSIKEFGIAATFKREEVLLAEVMKCELLCANCHAEYHASIV